ncbi:hypothetical protein OEA41_000269 [Lepraria neglecta]|uniref:Heterokaryon incompatibility domain-containing protein n=1 Tax=Lepraria neglecta TaxID=209136 RepID=A0AAE0DPB4_9LECA|nr:hypothetical protein OEA41_000269 [Lepraria neglecta]
MRHTRYWEVKYIWIDAICINQQDLIERGAQVSVMGDIYRAAQSVVIWLGPHDKQTDEAIQWSRGQDRRSQNSQILDDSGSVPDPDTIDAAMKVLKTGRSETCQRTALNSTSYAQIVKPACIKRQLFRTSNGFLGLGSESLRVGDEVVIATGSDVPLILRLVAGKPKTFQFVGAAYVHGIMQGEALELLFETDASFEDIVLV